MILLGGVYLYIVPISGGNLCFYHIHIFLEHVLLGTEDGSNWFLSFLGIKDGDVRWCKQNEPSKNWTRKQQMGILIKNLSDWDHWTMANGMTFEKWQGSPANMGWITMWRLESLNLSGIIPALTLWDLKPQQNIWQNPGMIQSESNLKSSRSCHLRQPNPTWSSKMLPGVRESSPKRLGLAHPPAIHCAGEVPAASCRQTRATQVPLDSERSFRILSSSCFNTFLRGKVTNGHCIWMALDPEGSPPLTTFFLKIGGPRNQPTIFYPI